MLLNPPYGERVRAKGADVPEDEAYERLFKAYGDHLKMNFSGWTAFLFSGDLGRPDLLGELGLEQDAQEPLARQLFRSLKEEFWSLPDFMQVWPGHGAGSACGKSILFNTGNTSTPRSRAV